MRKVSPLSRLSGCNDKIHETSLSIPTSAIHQKIQKKKTKVLRDLHFAQQLETGMNHINDQSVNDLPYNPLGSEKNSGVDHFNGV